MDGLAACLLLLTELLKTFELGSLGLPALLIQSLLVAGGEEPFAFESFSIKPLLFCLLTLKLLNTAKLGLFSVKTFLLQALLLSSLCF